MKPGVEAFLAEKTIAVVGVSRTRRIRNTAMQTLKERGYQVYPVNSRAETVEGERCYKYLEELPQGVGGVLTVVPPAQTLKVVEDCIRLGIRHIWMQQGSESKEGIRLAEANNVSLVHHACILMYAQPSGGHRVHRWIWKMLGKL